ncbi:glycosyltransferase family 2 protein [Pontimicrobium sp. MEBiC06410]
MKLSVIILNYNVCNFLELCLQSVEAAIVGLDAEIIVVDNNSKDESCSMVKTKFPNVKLIENKENFGFSKGNNIGIAEAKGEYLCILNPDTVVAEDTFKKVLNFADSKTNVGIVGCKLVDGNGDFLPESKRNIPTPSIAIKKILGNANSYYVNTLDENAIGQTAIFVGAFMLIKTKVYKEVNGLDEDYFMYGEDIDLSYKIIKAGYTSYYYGETTIIHYKGESTLKDKTYAKRFYGAMQIFYKKHFKNNLLFDALVWLGIQSARFISNNTEEVLPVVKQYAFISNANNNALESKLSKPVILASVETPITENTQVIFNANTVSYKAIIEQITNSEKNKGITFKILPKSSNFILGSHSSKSRGEVITF